MGLESYASGTGVNTYTNSDLRYALDECAFVNGAGYDNKLVNVDPDALDKWLGERAANGGPGVSLADYADLPAISLHR